MIEPSFGLGRLLYSLLEHSYECREGDAQRVVRGCVLVLSVLFLLHVVSFPGFGTW